jgi:hypothetical protein
MNSNSLGIAFKALLTVEIMAIGRMVTKSSKVKSARIFIYRLLYNMYYNYLDLSNKNMSPDHPSLRPRTLHVTIDPRIEFLAVVQHLAGYGQRFPLLTDFELAYLTEIETTFRSFRGHPVVKLFDQMSGTFHADAPPAAMFHLSEPPMLAVQIPFTDYLVKRAGGKDRLAQFITVLRDFAQASRFMDFYLAHSAFYASILQPIVRELSVVDDVAILEQYFGMQKHTYTLVLAPLFSGNGAYGARVCRDDGQYDLYSIAGTIGMDDKFHPKFDEPAHMRPLLWHEFAHSFVNPLTEQHLNTVNQYQALFRTVADQMTRYGYGIWEITVNEHIVRAVTVRLKTLMFGNSEGQTSLEQELSWGFAYTGRIVEYLKQYEAQRDRFPAFRDFYLELINAFCTDL